MKIINKCRIPLIKRIQYINSGLRYGRTPPLTFIWYPPGREVLEMVFSFHGAKEGSESLYRKEQYSIEAKIS